MYHDSCKTVGEQLWQEREGGCAQHGRPNTFCHPQQDTEENEHPTTGHHGSKTVCNTRGKNTYKCFLQPSRPLYSLLQLWLVS